MHLSKYQGLSRSLCRSRKGPRATQQSRKQEHRSCYHIDMPETENRNDSYLSEKASPATGYDWRRATPGNSSMSVVEFNQNSKELSSVVCFRGPIRHTSLPQSNPFGQQLTKIDRFRPRNDSLKGSNVADIRRAKQINELKHRIVNLPTHSPESNSRCITQVIQRITGASGPAEQRTKRSMNFRLKLKRPEVMKELMKAKLVSFSLSPQKLQTQHSDLAVAFYQTASNLTSVNSQANGTRTDFRRRNTLRNRIDRCEPEIKYTEPFEIQPWKIDL